MARKKCLKNQKLVAISIITIGKSGKLWDEEKENVKSFIWFWALFETGKWKWTIRKSDVHVEIKYEGKLQNCLKTFYQKFKFNWKNSIIYESDEEK